MGTRNENIITVIDLGSAKTLALVVETTEAGLRYRGHGLAPSGGTRRGVIVDLQTASRSVADAVTLAEHSSGLALESAVRPQLQGLLLTLLVIGLFVAAMVLAPRVRVLLPLAPAPAH